MEQLQRPANLATLLMRHFNFDEKLPASKWPDLSLERFVDEFQGKLEANYLFSVANKLVQADMLIDLGGSSLNRQFFCQGYSEIDDEYGVYENVVWGPGKIFENHGPAVRPVNVKDASGNVDVGTGFFLGNCNSFVTARHVVEDMSEVSVSAHDGANLSVISIDYHENPNVDLALLRVTGAETQSFIPFRVSEHSIGEGVITIGYPPIPGFDQLKILEQGEIGSEIKVMKGEVVGEGETYLAKVEHILVNARVKGGSSGAPIINRKGYVIGVVTASTINASSSQQVQDLGYGMAIPSYRLREL